MPKAMSSLEKKKNGWQAKWAAKVQGQFYLISEVKNTLNKVYFGILKWCILLLSRCENENLGGIICY